MTEHDAKMTYRDTRQGEMVTWGWTDGRRTVTPTEHEGIKEYTGKAEEKLDYSLLESGETVARVWMNDDETVNRIEWLE